MKHQYLDLADGTISGGLFRKMYRGQVCNLVFFPRKDAQRFGFSDEKTEKTSDLQSGAFPRLQSQNQKDPQDLRATYLINTIRHLKNVRPYDSLFISRPKSLIVGR